MPNPPPAQSTPQWDPSHGLLLDHFDLFAPLEDSGARCLGWKRSFKDSVDRQNGEVRGG